MKASSLLNGISYKGNADIEVSSVVCDSRKVVPGSMFVCVKGYQSDGHSFAKTASEQGASVILAQDEIAVDCPVIYTENTRKALAVACANFHDNPSKKFTLIGITGTNGKTTTTFLIKHMLECDGKKVGLIGTNQNMIGDKIIETSRTTPDSFELQALFAKMAEEKVDAVVMEVSSHALYLDRVYASDFDLGLFTNLTQDHLDFHGTMENYRDAKGILFNNCKKGVLNMDDVASETFLKTGTCQFLGYSINNSSDLNAENVELHKEGVSFDVNGVKFDLAIPGEFSVYNGLCAISAMYALGYDLEFIRNALSTAHGVKGRAQVINLGFDFTVLIDYAHTPDGIENILKTARGFAKGRVVILFGCGGDRDPIKRPLMGKIASSLADFSIITSDNPRTEVPSAIIEDILKGVDGEHVVIENRKEAIRYALKNAKKDDVIILAGKGHENYQIIGTEKFHFDEEEILFEIKDEIESGV